MRENNSLLDTPFDVLVTDVVIFIGGYLICSMICSIFLMICGGWPHMKTEAVFAGLIIWTIIFFFCGLFKRCVKFPPAKEVWIMGDPLIREVVPSDGAIQRDRPIHAQRPIQAGPNMTFPWEYRAGIVNMSKHSLGDEEDKDSYTTADGNQVLINYEFFWSVIPGYEINHFRFQEDSGDETKIAEYLRGMMRAFLQRYCIERNMLTLIGNLDAINRAFTEEFLSGRELRDIEKKIGAQITDGRIQRISPSEREKEARESRLEVEAIADAVAYIQEKNPDFSREKCWDYALVGAGKSGVEVRRTEENFNLDVDVKGAPGLQHLVFPGGASAGGGKGKGGGGKQPQNQGGQGQQAKNNKGKNRRRNP